VNLLVSVGSDFRYRNYPAEEAVALSTPGVPKLEIKAASMGRYYNSDWFELEPFNFYNEDTVFVRNIRLRITKSPTDSFQVMMVKRANGDSRNQAGKVASRINFNISQIDSSLSLDKGIAITKQDKFRNQQVIVTVAVPVGKRIYINDNIGRGNSVRVHMGHSDNDDRDWENNMESESFNWRHNVEYVMTEKGLQRADKQTDEDDENDNSNEAIEEFRKSREQIEREKEQKIKELEEIDRELQKATDSTRYRYKSNATDSTAVPKREGRKLKPRRDNITDANFPTGINDMLMIKFSL
jgi:prefoldin subunit 5